MRRLLGRFIPQQLQLHIIQSIGIDNSASGATTDRRGSTGMLEHSKGTASAPRAGGKGG